jgi:hypothetical protein
VAKPKKDLGEYPPAKAGQIWEPLSGTPRMIKLLVVHASGGLSGGWAEAENIDTRRKSKVQLSRLKPDAGGYRFVKDKA